MSQDILDVLFVYILRCLSTDFHDLSILVDCWSYVSVRMVIFKLCVLVIVGIWGRGYL